MNVQSVQGQSAARLNPLTFADIDEWLSLLDTPTGMPTPDFVPNDWARAGLGTLLGETVPYRAWHGTELRQALLRARDVAITTEGMLF